MEQKTSRTDTIQSYLRLYNYLNDDLLASTNLGGILDALYIAELRVDGSLLDMRRYLPYIGEDDFAYLKARICQQVQNTMDELLLLSTEVTPVNIRMKFIANAHIIFKSYLPENES